MAGVPPRISGASASSASLKDFTVIQPLGKGSYGSVHKVVRKSDGLRCGPATSRAQRGCTLARQWRTTRMLVPRASRSYAIKEVNIRKLSTRERCVACRQAP